MGARSARGFENFHTEISALAVSLQISTVLKWNKKFTRFIFIRLYKRQTKFCFLFSVSFCSSGTKTFWLKILCFFFKFFSIFFSNFFSIFFSIFFFNFFFQFFSHLSICTPRHTKKFWSKILCFFSNFFLNFLPYFFP